MFEQIFEFFQSFNKYQAIITIIVGSIAYFLYKKSRRDNKIDAAKLIIQEVRYAEELIRNARDVGYNYALANKILPTNSWHKNIHLFIKNLGETDIDTISKFYSNVAYLDKIINYISEFINKKNLTPEILDEKDPQKLQEEVKKMQAQRIAALQLSQKFLKEVSEKIDLIYNTPAIDKLRVISEKKWHQLF
jgi:hypothetical protein